MSIAKRNNLNTSVLKNSKYYVFIAFLFVMLLLFANIAAQKIVPIGKFALLTIGDFIFPLVYIADNILTEVYGYAASRRVIWLALCVNALFAAIIFGFIKLSAVYDWNVLGQFMVFFTRVPQIVFASFIAFFVGEFANSFLLAKLKVITSGRFFWIRSFSSLSIGQGLDTALFSFFAFFGILTGHEIFFLAISVYCFKLLYELMLTPLIYVIVLFLKRKDKIDAYDRDTDFNPFSIDLA